MNAQPHNLKTTRNTPAPEGRTAAAKRIRRALAMLVLPAAATCGLIQPTASAAPMLSFSASDGGTRSALVSFTQSSDKLAVELSNTSTADVTIPSQVLTGIFLDISGSFGSWTPLSAQVAPTSHVELGGQTVTAAPQAGPNVSGEWAYKQHAYVYGMNSCISSAGLGVCGKEDRFGTLNLNGPDSPGGLEYGLLSKGDNPLTGNSKVRAEPLIKDTVVFEFHVPQTFNLSHIRGVVFQYGTSLSEPHVVGQPVAIPEPERLALLALAWPLARRKRKQQ